ncbi:hypothetical protein MMC30_003593 [Trapelia coarctata]|nr:hypothetical protein [Trapelia coarctata]
MVFKLEEVNPDTDFDELMACEWESYENPSQTFFRLFCPIHGTGPNARAESIKEATARQLAWHQSDPTSYWQKVVDVETRKIIGGALWKICKTNPFEQEQHSEAYWIPTGGQRDFVNKALEQFEAPRAKMGQRPQVYLNIIFTHPAYRRKGAGDLMMDWGIQKAEEMGVEMWLDATVYGVPLYKKHGFAVVNESDIRPTTDKPDVDWEMIEHDLIPMVMWQMWRPVGGMDKEGKTIRPWNEIGASE